MLSLICFLSGCGEYVVSMTHKCRVQIFKLGSHQHRIFKVTQGDYQRSEYRWRGKDVLGLNPGTSVFKTLKL